MSQSATSSPPVLQQYYDAHTNTHKKVHSLENQTLTQHDSAEIQKQKYRNEDELVIKCLLNYLDLVIPIPIFSPLISFEKRVVTLATMSSC